jgi:Family of unknown function (DUF6232)
LGSPASKLEEAVVAQEVPIYQDATIQVTNLRAMLPGKTYAMANVTSVSVFTQYGNTAPGVVVAVLGVFIALIGFAVRDALGCFVLFAAILIVAGVVYARSVKNIYWVRIGSASGETNALRSHDREYIMRVVNAMNEAIVRRG